MDRDAPPFRDALTRASSSVVIFGRMLGVECQRCGAYERTREGVTYCEHLICPIALREFRHRKRRRTPVRPDAGPAAPARHAEVAPTDVSAPRPRAPVKEPTPDAHEARRARGRLGGEAVRDRYGSPFFSVIGRLGAQRRAEKKRREG